MQALKDKNSKAATNRDQLLKIDALYYGDLYTSKVEVPRTNTPPDTSEIPDITVEEVTFALDNMKLGKAPSKDNITTDLLKNAGRSIHKAIAQLFTQCL